ncbi:10129_t:CDS:2, partial [Cetraspora pellucida]
CTLYENKVYLSSEMPPQPQTLDEVDILLPFQYTLKGELFLIRDLQVGLEELYMQLFQDLNDFAAENEFILKLLKIITDFKIATINASCNAFLFKAGIPRTQNKIEAWHQCWDSLVDHAYVEIYTIIKEF